MNFSINNNLIAGKRLNRSAKVFKLYLKIENIKNPGLFPVSY